MGIRTLPGGSHWPEVMNSFEFMTLGLVNFHVYRICCCPALESLGLKGFLRVKTATAKTKMDNIFVKAWWPAIMSKGTFGLHRGS